VNPARQEPGAEAPEASLWQTLKSVLGDLPGLVSDRVHLLALELQRAGLALAQIMALATAAAILASTAWLALWTGAAFALVQAGLAWGWVLAGVILLNLGAAAVAMRRARALLRWLALPATFRHLTLPAAPEPPPPDRPEDESLRAARHATAA
jgi:Putative Actinobacterial Holin-X, holin superfamily III